MCRLLAPLAVMSVILLGPPPGSPAQIKPGDLKDYNGAVKAMRSDKAPDRAAGLSFLALLGKDAKGASREVVSALFDGDAEVRKWAGTALGKVNPELSTPVLNLVRSEDYATRVAALEELSKLGDAAGPSVPALRKFLEKAEPADRAKVVKSLSAVGAKDSDLAELFATMAVRDADPDVRKAATQGLTKQTNPRGGVDFFTGLLGARETDPKQRAAAITVLIEVGNDNPEAVKQLQELTKNESPMVRAAAKQALEKIQAAKKKP